MRDGRIARQAGVAAAQCLGHSAMAHREALDMQLVEHGVGQRNVRAAVALPVVQVCDNACLQGVGCVVAGVHARWVAPVGSEVFFTPGKAADDLARTGVEQQLVRVEAMALRGLPRAMRTQPVDQPRPGAGEVAMPDVVAARRQREPAQFMRASVVEQAQLDALRVRREDGDVDALAIPVRAEWPRMTGADGGGHRGGGHQGFGVMPQMRVAYSRIVRSDENAPMPATLAIARAAHCAGWRYSASTRACVST